MNHSMHKKSMAFRISYAAIFAILIALSVVLVEQYRRIQELDYLAQNHSLFSSLRGARSLATSQASSTEAWMTFEYINHIFRLPPQYLETALSIRDSRYPRLTIADYAESVRAPQSDILSKVQDAIRSFSTSTPTN